MDKYKNKYRIPSTRLQSWDYKWDAAYFITICTDAHLHLFGTIENGKMSLSNVDIIADILWHEIPNHSQNVELGSFVVMPNHIHGILILSGNNTEINTTIPVETGHALSPSPKTNNVIMKHDVKTGNDIQTGLALSLQNTNPQTSGQQRYQNIGANSASSIIGSYKSAVTKHSHRMGFEFKWQTRFYDHIIRNEKEFELINAYILNNPANWELDKLFKSESDSPL